MTGLIRGLMLAVVVLLVVSIAAIVYARQATPPHPSATVASLVASGSIAHAQPGAILAVRGLLRPVRKGGTVSYVLSDPPAQGQGGLGLSQSHAAFSVAIAPGPAVPIVSGLHQLLGAASFVPATPDQPVVGQVTVYLIKRRAAGATPWFQLASGGE